MAAGLPNKREQFQILVDVMAMVEERQTVPLAEAATAVGVSTEALRDIVSAVLFVSFHPPSSVNPIDHSYEILLDADDDLVLDHDGALHGLLLRNLVTRPPERDTALDLYLSALIVDSLAPDRHLASSLEKLAGLVRVTLVVPLEQPPALGVVQQAWADHRSVHCRYLAEGSTEATEREIVPWRVYANWGRWYVKGTAVEHGEERTYRIDRMLDARMGDVEHERPEHVAIPAWFEMDHNTRSVRVRMPASTEPSLATPIRFTDRVALADGWEEVTITVHGDTRLDHLLVSLPPDAEVLNAPELAERRRAHARHLLADYD